MLLQALSEHPANRTSAAFSARIPHLVLAACVLLGVACYLEAPRAGPALLGASGALLSLAGLIWWLSGRHSRARARVTDGLAAYIENDASPGFTTDANGNLRHLNKAARDRFGAAGGVGEPLSRLLRDLLADPGAVLFRLQGRAEATGAAREDVLTSHGHERLAVHRVDPESYLWRIEDLLETGAPGRGADGMSLPMLTATGNGDILSMNGAMRRLVGSRVRKLDQILADPPPSPDRIHEIRTVDGPARTRLIDIEGPEGRREIYLLPVGEDPRADHASLASAPILDGLPVALLRLSRDGTLVSANRAARELLGASVDPGVELRNLVEGLGRSVRDWLEEAAEGRGLGRPEFLRASMPDRELYLQITLGRIYEEGELGLVAVVNDATELKTLEAQFVQSQKMQAIGQLAGGVAHDFNNLLTAISGHCDLLLLRHDQGDQDYADLVQINQNANRAASLVGQLLAYSRKQNLQPEVLDLRETLSDLAHLLNRLVGERVSLVLKHDPGLRPIRADKRQLEQVVMNLVVNARDAMPDGGNIRIETESTRIDQPLKRDRASVAPGDYVIVRVSDEGVGIPADKLSKIFEPFFTTKRTGEGTGLGLSTAYGIVKQTGGFIFVDSTVGEGTTFSLYFPAHLGKPETVDTRKDAAPTYSLQQPGTGVVLLVEDEAPVRAFASRALRMRGYTVLEAESAEDALEQLEDPDVEVDVFVTDVVMPGMDGPTWVRRALERRPDVRVVFVSGYAEESFTDEQSRIPNSVFLPKPFSLNELTATVSRSC